MGAEFTKMFPLLAIFVMNPDNSINNNWSDKDMMNKKILGVMALALVMIVGACPAFAAQQNSASHTVTVQVQPTISISVDKNITMSVLADGVPASDTATITSLSNKEINVFMTASAMLKDGGASTDADDLGLGDIAFLTTSTYGGSGASGFLSTGNTPVYTNLPKASKGGSTSFTNKFTVTAPFGTNPGNYNTTVTYSAVAI